MRASSIFGIIFNPTKKKSGKQKRCDNKKSNPVISEPEEVERKIKCAASSTKHSTTIKLTNPNESS